MWFKNHNSNGNIKQLIGSVIFGVLNLAALVLFVWILKTGFEPLAGRAATGIYKALNFRGTLKNSDGSTVSNGTYSMYFSIYNAASGGSCLYTARGTCGAPTAKTVTVASGVFSTLLGDTDNGDNVMTLDFNDDTYWLGVKVGTDSELTPRVRIGAAGYAINANLLDGLDTSSSGGTVRYIPATDYFGNLLLTGEPRGEFAASSTLYINTASATSTNSLFGLAVGGTEKFKVDASGNVAASGSIYASGAATSTFIGGVQMSVLNVTSVSATSTFANGIQLTSGCYLMPDGSCAGAGSGWTDDGNEVRLTSASDNVTVGGAGTLAKLTVLGDADERQFVIRAATQTANMFEIQSSAGTIVWANSTGNFGASGTIYGSLATSTWDNTVIGASTPAAGTFTQLISTGITRIGNGANIAEVNSTNWTISTDGKAVLNNISSTFSSVYQSLFIGDTATTTIYGSTTSTFAAGLQTPALNITSNTATSTFANGIQLSGGCFRDIAGTCVNASGSNLWVDGADELYLQTSADNVTVGGAGSLAKLTVLGDANEKQLVIKANATQTANIFEIQDSSNNPIVWANSTGNFGASGTIYGSLATSTWDNTVIGASTPAAGYFTNVSSSLLSVYNTAYFGSTATATIINGVYTGSIATSTWYGSIATTTFSNLVINNLNVTNSSTLANLNLLEPVYIGNGSATDTILYGSANTTSTFGYGLTFANLGGNVGIGTTAPAYLLDVNGTLRAAGIIYPDRGIATSTWDNTVIGASTPAAGTFTQLISTGITRIGNGTNIAEVNSTNWMISSEGLAVFPNSSSTVASAYQGFFVGTTATTSIYGGTTSTFGAGVNATALNITSNTVTSTFANGIQITSGCFRDVTGTCVSASSSNLWIDGTDELYLQTSTDNVTVGASGNLAKLTVLGDANEKQFVIKANGTQTANIFEIQDSSNNPIVWANSTGNFGASGTIYGSLATSTWYGSIATSTWYGSLATSTWYASVATSTWDAVQIGRSTAWDASFINVTSTGRAMFNKASTTLFSIFDKLYFGGTVTSTFQSGARGSVTSTLYSDLWLSSRDLLLGGSANTGNLWIGNGSGTSTLVGGTAGYATSTLVADTEIENLYAGIIEFNEDGGVVPAMNIPVSNASTGTIEGYTFQVDTLSVMTVGARADGLASVWNKFVGINTSTPYGQESLSVNGTIAVGTFGTQNGTSTFYGDISATGTINVAGAVSSTFARGLQAAGLSIANNISTSTIIGGTIYSYGTGGGTPLSGEGTKFMWIPAKSAIRAGYAASTQWDDGYIGSYSAAFGASTIASGTYAFAGGFSSQAAGDASLAFGDTVKATSTNSVAFGNSVYSGGLQSFAAGYDTQVYGDYSFGFGNLTRVRGDYSFAFGGGNLDVNGNYSTGIGLDLFATPRNISQDHTLGILGGKVGIGGTSPTAVLEISTSTWEIIGLWGDKGVNLTEWKGAFGSNYIPIAWVNQSGSFGASGTLMVGNAGTQNGTSTFYGNIAATGTITANCTGTCLDIAEQYASSDKLEPGDVVVSAQASAGESADSAVKKSDGGYAANVVGIVSTNPGLVLTDSGVVMGKNGSGGSDKPNIAMVGRVPVKVTNENGTIKKGDLLATSLKEPGHAMKLDAAGFSGMAGVFAMALEDWNPETEKQSPDDSGVLVNKISVLIKNGFVLNGQSASSAFESEADASALTVESDASNIGPILVKNGIDMGGASIINIAAIQSAEGKWQISESGDFFTAGEIVKKVATSQGEKNLYPIYNGDPTMMFAGSGELINGEARIIFDPAVSELMDSSIPIKTSVTLTSEGAQGVYVAEKSIGDILVKEINGGQGSARFDYIIVATRRMSGSANEGGTQMASAGGQGGDFPNSLGVAPEETSASSTTGALAENTASSTPSGALIPIESVATETATSTPVGQNAATSTPVAVIIFPSL